MLTRHRLRDQDVQLQIIPSDLAQMAMNAGCAARLLTCMYFLSRFSMSQTYNDKQSVFYQ